MDPDGYVAVDWLGNSYPVRGRHRPQELYRVESEGDEDAGSEESSENASGENSENDEWDTASEEGNPGDDNELAEIIDSLVEESLSAISPPANEDPETPASPLVLNVDVEALNNANHLENEVERSSESDAGTERFRAYILREFQYCTLERRGHWRHHPVTALRGFQRPSFSASRDLP